MIKFHISTWKWKGKEMLLLNSTITLQRPLSMTSYKYVSVRRKALCTSCKFCFCSGSAFVLLLLCTSCKLYLCFRFFLIPNYHYKVTQSPYFSLYLSLAIIYLIMLLRVFPLKDLLMARNILILILQHFGFQILKRTSSLQLFIVIVDSVKMTLSILIQKVLRVQNQ